VIISGSDSPWRVVCAGDPRPNDERREGKRGGEQPERHPRGDPGSEAPSKSAKGRDGRCHAEPEEDQLTADTGKEGRTGEWTHMMQHMGSGPGNRTPYCRQEVPDSTA
jgi:hypothetical protein